MYKWTSLLEQRTNRLPVYWQVARAVIFTRSDTAAGMVEEDGLLETGTSFFKSIDWMTQCVRGERRTRVGEAAELTSSKSKPLKLYASDVG